MNILIINCGSSSLSFKVYQAGSQGKSSVIISGKARNVATQTKGSPELDWVIDEENHSRTCEFPDHRRAGKEVLAVLAEKNIMVDAVGHRFVHGGEIFSASVLIDDQTHIDLQKCLPLAPIHNPNSLSVIDLFRQELSDVPQYAVFDTAFHAQLPPETRTYAIPRELAQRYGLYKYGFHGISCQYVSEAAARYLGKPIDQVKLILCHLGSGGSSVTAFRDGHSIDTSMGFSPLAGLVMSTRCGDIDGEVVLELVRRGYSADEVSHILNKESGLIGLSGFSSNLAEVIEAAEAGNETCRIAYEGYANRLKFYLGAYTWLLDGADAIVFTDDIGVSSWKLREKVLGQAEHLGVYLDSAKNRQVEIKAVVEVNRADSPLRLLVIPTDEEVVIFREVMKLLAGN
jgi:acetate kinase